MPELRFAITQPQKSVLTRQHIWTIDSGISYTGSIGWRITDQSIRSNTRVNTSLDGWQSQLSLSEDRGSFPWSIDNAMHTLVLQSHAQVLGTYKTVYSTCL